MHKAFSEARANNSRGLALLIQANPKFENYWPAGAKIQYLNIVEGARPPEKAQSTGFDDYIKTLTEEMETYT
jgi:hypothetical protein